METTPKNKMLTAEDMKTKTEAVAKPVQKKKKRFAITGRGVVEADSLAEILPDSTKQ